jgi:hypothetical protein
MTGLRLGVAVLLAAMLLACGGSTPPRASIEAPSFDAAAVQQLLDDAMADLDRLAGDPPVIELPAEVAALLEEADIRLPAVPSNAAEICQTLGTPGDAGATGAGLRPILEGFVAGGEVGLAVALLSTVVFSTCPTWSPHIETLLQEGL